jgi:hypothetical protein
MTHQRAAKGILLKLVWEDRFDRSGKRKFSAPDARPFGAVGLVGESSTLDSANGAFGSLLAHSAACA